MNILNERIKTDGIVIKERILKIDSFLNHQIDPKIMNYVVSEFKEYFKNSGITKVLTIEASGIAPAIMTAAAFEVPMLFAKKAKPNSMTSDFYVTNIYSYTKEENRTVIISKEFLNKNDRVLIIDDFLAMGEASLGLIDLVKQADAEVAGIGICVEKSFQIGRQRLEDAGVDVFSISRITSLKDNTIRFMEG